MDLSRFFPKPGRQKGETCAAWATGYTRAFYVNLLEQRNVNDDRNVPSPPYIFDSIKSGNKGKGCMDGGSTFLDAFKLLLRGSLSLHDYPNLNVEDCFPLVVPGKSATDFRITNFELVAERQPTGRLGPYAIDAIRSQLAQNNPVLLSILATPKSSLPQESSAFWQYTCVEPECKWTGHAIAAVGYDDSRRALKIINSWGQDWGEGGFAWISYATAKEEVMEAYVMKVAPPPPPPPAPPTCSLSVTPSSVVQGSVATVSFFSKNATRGAISNGIGVVGSSGSQNVSPAQTTTYVGTFAGPGGNATCATTVTVTPPPSPPPAIVSFKASPERIVAGQNATLTWSIKGATSVQVDSGVGRVEGDSTTVSPAVSTTYTVTARNKDGSATAATTVSVVKSSPLILPDERCGKVEVVHRNGRTAVTGFVGKVEDLEWVNQNAKGMDIDVDVRPWPQCEALMTLDASIARAADDGLKVDIRRSSKGNILKADDQLVFEVQTPAYPSYVHVAYIQADGSVLNFTKLGDGLSAPRPPSSKLVFGTGAEWGRFRVTAPYGREMLIVLAAKRPIFQQSRPNQETEREFMTAVKSALSTNPDSVTATDIIANYDAIITAER
jgi:hypothetical protein